ncbi:tape measure protein [Pseudomonas sp. D1-3]
MSEKVIATLVGRLKFDVDSAPLLRFEKMMDNINRKMRELEKQATRLERKLGIAPKGSATIQKQLQQQQRLTQAQFQQMLKTSKLQLSVDQQQAKLQSLQAKAGTQQARQAQAEHRAQLQQLKTSQAAHQYSIRQEQSRLKLQQEQLRTSAAASRLEATRQRTQAASDRARLTALKLEERLNKRLPGAMRSPSGRAAPAPSQSIWRGGRGFSSSMGHVASAGLGAGVGASIPGLGMFSAGLHPAAMALGALATAAITAQVKLNEFAEADISAFDTRRTERANLSVLADGDTQLRARLEKELSSFADSLGLVRSEIAKPFVMSAINLTDAGLQRDQSIDLIQGIMRFARGTGLNSDDMGGALRAIGQAFSKGQLMSEEWKGQFAERVAGADKLGVQAWAEITRSGLKGQAAKASFSDAMADGKISGDQLNKFFIVLGRMMNDKSNLGGRLDTIAQSAESSQARIQNMTTERSIRTAEYDDGALKQSSIELYQAKERLQVSLEKLIPGFSTLESASLRLETRFTDTSTKMVGWLERTQTAVDQFFDNPRFAVFFENARTFTDKVLTPLINLLTDVITFMASTAFENIGAALGLMADGLNALSPVLDQIPEALNFMIEKLREGIGQFFTMLGLGDKWRAHNAERKDRGLTSEAPFEEPRMPFLARPAPLIPEAAVSALDRWTQTPAQAMQQLIDSSTTNTNNVVTNQFHVQVNASGANAEEVANQLTDRFQQMASDAARGVIDTTLRVTKANYGQVKQ